MDERGVGLAELNAGMLETLVTDARAVWRRESCWFAGRWFSSASERDVLAYLRELGIVEPAVVPVPTQVDLLIARFVEYLARERGTSTARRSIGMAGLRARS